MSLSKIGARSPLTFGYRNASKALAIDSATGGTQLPNAARFKSDGPMTAADQAAMVMQADAVATNLIRQRAQPIIQEMQSQAMGAAATNNAALGQTFTYNLTNVGLNRRVILEFTGTITPTNETITATPFSVVNLIDRLVLTDLSNYDRINTKGRHLHALATARKRANYGAAYANDGIARIANNLAVQSAPQQANAAFSFRFFIELPLCYTPDDYRGAIWANVTGGTWRVAITVNNTPFAGSAATDLSNVAYQSDQAASGALLTALNVKIHQDYLYDVPVNPKTGEYILPTMSLAHNYLLLTAPYQGVIANSDFAIQYTNNRTFLSTMFEYVNNSTMNPGTDINYVGVQIANQLFVRKTDPWTLALATRELIGGDYPPGFYYIDHREKPILTNNSGNTQLVINASSSTNGQGNAFWEMISIQNAAVNGTSLPSS